MDEAPLPGPAAAAPPVDVTGLPPPVGPSGWRKAIAFLPPILLAIVAVNHVILSRSSDLSPWKGGGFGMFATIDSPGRRALSAYFTVEGRRIPIRLPPDDPAGALINGAITFPSQGSLARLADMLSRRQWVRDPLTGAAVPHAANRQGMRLMPEGLGLEVYRILFMRTSLEVEPLLIAHLTRDLR